jgi:hypothetical protein
VTRRERTLLAAVTRRERTLLAAAIVLGLAVRVAYVLATRHYRLAGDELEYDLEGRFIAAGHWFWTQRPYGFPHPGAWKAPGYPAWVGLWYAVLGHSPMALRLVQVPLGAITIALGHRLARALFGPRVALAAAFVIAVYPLAFQYEELLYSESLATPLTLAVLLATFGGRPTARRSLVTAPARRHAARAFEQRAAARRGARRLVGRHGRAAGDRTDRSGRGHRRTCRGAVDRAQRDRAARFRPGLGRGRRRLRDVQRAGGPRPGVAVRLAAGPA